jgi:hypothetical protein
MRRFTTAENMPKKNEGDKPQIRRFTFPEPVLL